MNRPSLIAWLAGNTGSALIALLGFGLFLYRAFVLGDATFIPVVGWMVAAVLAMNYNQQLSDYLVYKQRQREIERQTGMTNPNLTFFEGRLEGVGASLLSLICFSLGLALFASLGWFVYVPGVSSVTPDDVRSAVPFFLAGMSLALLGYGVLKLRKRAPGKSIGSTAKIFLAVATVFALISFSSSTPMPLEVLLALAIAATLVLRLALMAWRIARRLLGYAPSKAAPLKNPPLNKDGWPLEATAVPAKRAAAPRNSGAGVRTDVPDYVRDMLIRERKRAEEERAEALKREAEWRSGSTNGRGV